MTKKDKLIIFDVFILAIVLFGGYLIVNSYINYAVIVLAIAVSFIIQELTYRFTGDTKEEKYETKLKKIITNSFIIILLSAILSFSINYFYTDFILYFLYDNNLANIITKKLAFLFILLYFFGYATFFLNFLT